MHATRLGPNEPKKLLANKRFLIPAAATFFAGSLLLSPLRESIFYSRPDFSRERVAQVDTNRLRYVYDPRETFTFNSKRVLEIAMNDDSIKPLLKKGRLTRFISDRLKSVQHVARPDLELPDDGINITDMAPRELKRLGASNCVRICYLLKALESIDFRKQVGLELELDTPDKKGEHGGNILISDSGKLTLAFKPNCNELFSGYPMHPDSFYARSDPFELKLFSFFHFHAVNVDCSKFAGPSNGDFEDYVGVIFTRVGEKKFNVDYIGTILGKRDISFTLDLGVYSY